MDVTNFEDQITENHGFVTTYYINYYQIFSPNQSGNLLKLNRSDTFRKVIYFYSLTDILKTT